MPPLQGEVTLLNLFADVHYFISPPNHRPLHHRFEKSCYVYLYTSQSASNPRIEIANNPGTLHQDAFSGSLTNCALNFAHRQPNLITGSIMHKVQEHDQTWQLRSLDLAQEKESIYLLHTIDLYFWTADDAGKFVEACRKLEVGELNVDGQKVGTVVENVGHTNEHRDQMSPVVQRLEQAAISPSTTRGFQSTDSTSTTSPLSQPQPQRAQTFPLPPSSGSLPQQTMQNNVAPAQPLAYNPAAPPPPEPISHREKTPPPVDADGGTGLSAAALHEHGTAPIIQPNYPYSEQHVRQQQQQVPQSQHGSYQGQQIQYQTQQQTPQQPAPSSFSPPPSQHQGSFSPHPPPPPPAQGPTTQALSHSQQQYQHQHSQTSTFSAPPTSPAYQIPQQPYRQPTLPFQQYASPPTSPGHPPSASASSPYNPQALSPSPHQNPTHPSNPNYPSYSSTPAQQLSHPQSQTQSPPPPPPQPSSPYSSITSPPLNQHTYGKQQIPSAQNIHSQLYQPSEAELQHKPNAGPGPITGQAPGKTEGRADRLEKGVNRFLKKLDKHL